MDSDCIHRGIGSGAGGHPRHVTVYVAVPDVEAALNRAEELGGRRLVGPDIVPATESNWASSPTRQVI